MARFSTQVQRREDGGCYAFLSGVMDENADLAGFFAGLEGPTTLNLQGITRINSLGVHQWIREIEPYSQRVSVQIEACSYVVCMQANVVANFFGAAKVLSLMAPFYCTPCKENRTVIVTRDEILQARGLPPVKQCPACDATMEFDELEEYFDFIRS